jgi:glucose-1-phosphate adenylyltransferase
MIMAGGKGERLHPLTRDRSKPAVPFGGRHRIVDFVLSNFINSGIYAIYILTQFKSQSLSEHVREAWGFSSVLEDHFVIPVPAQMQMGDDWYQGTADAVYQNLHLVQRTDPKIVAVFGADHIYKMNIHQMVEHHRAVGAEATVAVVPVRIAEAPSYGVLEVDPSWRVIGFEEKPRQPRPIPDEPEYALVSMGNYLFGTELLVKTLPDDAQRITSSHDFGRDIIPALVREERRVYAYDFRRNRIPTPLKGEEPSYWRDVGTIDAYYEASMDLRAIDPVFNLYNRSWPIRTVSYGDPPAKFVFDEEGRRGTALNSIVSEGTIISGSVVRGSVISPNVRIHSYCLIEDAVIMNRVEIGRGCRIRRAIVDKNVHVLPGTEIGYNRERDRERFFVTESGIAVIPREEPKSLWPYRTGS